MGIFTDMIREGATEYAPMQDYQGTPELGPGTDPLAPAPIEPVAAPGPGQDPRGTAYGVDGTNLNRYGGIASPSWVPQPFATASEFLDGLTSMLHQGITFGFGDEINSFLVSGAQEVIGKITGTGPGTSREELLQRKQAENLAFREDHPVAAAAAEIAGGGALVAPITGAAKAVSAGAQVARTAAAKKAAEIPGAVGSLTRGGLAAAEKVTAPIRIATGGPARRVATAGAAGGALYGAGDTPVGESRGLHAAFGGGAGAVGGLALPWVARGASGLYKGVRSRWDDKTFAKETIRDFMDIDELTVPQLRKRLDEHALPKGQGGPMIVDVGGEAIQALGAKSIKTIGPERTRVRKIYEDRAEGEVERLTTSVKQAISPDDFYKSQMQITQEMKDTATPLYREAYDANKSLMSKELSEILDRPSVKQALRQSVRMMQDDRSKLAIPDAELGELARQASEWKRIPYPTGGVAAGLDLRVLDYTKRRLDHMITMARRGTDPNLTNVRTLVRLRKDLVDELDKLDTTSGEGAPGAYSRARSAWAGDQATLEALDLGKKFRRLQPQEIAVDMANLPDSARKAYRTGAAQSILEDLSKNPDAQDFSSAAKRIKPHSLAAKQLREIAGSDEAYAELIRSLDAELAFAKSQRAVVGDIGPRLSEETKGFLNTMGSLGAVLGSMVPGGGHALVKAGIGRRIAMGLAKKKGDVAISKMLMEQDLATNMALLDALEKAPRDVFINRAINFATLAVIQQSAMTGE